MHRRRHSALLAFVLAVCTPLLTPQFGAARDTEAQCLLGEPLGAAYLSIELKPGEPLPALQEADGRAVYVVSQRRRRGLILNRGEFARYWFLFHGREPLQLRLDDAAGTRLVLEPQASRQRAARQLTEQWWQRFRREAEERIEAGGVKVVDQYLLAMLARRMKLPLEIDRRQQRSENKPLATAELLAGAERLRARMLREAVLRQAPQAMPAADVPAPAFWAEPPEQPAAEDVAVEPLANHAPADCFYIRFGKFSDFLWLTHLIREQGGDLGNMISSQAVQRDMDGRFERQFAIRYSVIADLLGDQVVSDLALIGSDLYLRDGSAMGVMLQAKNSLLLDTALNRERSASVSREAGKVRRSKIKIGRHEVDLIASQDNAVRSFLASHGDVRLVSNSRHVVERFLAVADGEQPLGGASEFRHARTLLPLERGDTIFAHFSNRFFHNLVSPQYQIELRRRLRSICDLQLIELARLAARREGLPEDEASLAAAGLLPGDWNVRVDGSRIERLEDGRWADSLRGARGTFLPIPDVKMSQVSQHERQQYRQLASYYQDQWRTMDPLMAGVRRYSVEGQPRRERLVIDAHISPFVDRKYGPWLTLLGPPTRDRVSAPDDAVVVGQASLRGGVWRPEIEAHQVFLGILDRRPAIRDLQTDGLLDALLTIRAVPGYLGSWPRTGLLDYLPLSANRTEDEQGYSMLPLRLWRYRQDEWSAFSFSRGLLETAADALDVEQAEAPAQVWGRVVDLTETKLAPWIRDVNYRKAVEVTRGTARSLTTLSTHLGAGDGAPQAAANLVDGQLQCPLGGDYVREGGAWQATGIAERDWEAPEGYTSPVLRWFRGAAVMLNGAGSGRLTLHAEIDIQRAEPDSLLDLPLLNGLPKLFGN